jgi:hypothetical protein
MTTDEVWKHHPIATGYEVSTLGRVRAIGKEVLTPGGKATYQHITTTKPDKKTRYIHHMVLETFVGPRPGKFHASHINGNCRDNRLENLIWESPQSNCARRMGHGTELHGEMRWSSKLKYDEAVTIKVSPMSNERLAKVFGISASEAGRIKTGATWAEIPPLEIRKMGDTIAGKDLA